MDTDCINSLQGKEGGLPAQIAERRRGGYKGYLADDLDHRHSRIRRLTLSGKYLTKAPETDNYYFAKQNPSP